MQPRILSSWIDCGELFGTSGRPAVFTQERSQVSAAFAFTPRISQCPGPATFSLEVLRSRSRQVLDPCRQAFSARFHDTPKRLWIGGEVIRGAQGVQDLPRKESQPPVGLLVHGGAFDEVVHVANVDKLGLFQKVVKGAFFSSPRWKTDGRPLPVGSVRPRHVG
jgi:hypothetical protein